MHQLLVEQQILYLISRGFATNWCVRGQNYSIQAIAGRGYNIILLPDTETGAELPDRQKEIFTTWSPIGEVQPQYGFIYGFQSRLSAIL